MKTPALALALALAAFVGSPVMAGAVNGSVSLGAISLRDANSSDVTTLTGFTLNRGFADISSGTNGDFDIVESASHNSPYDFNLSSLNVTLTANGLTFTAGSLGTFTSDSYTVLSSVGGNNAAVSGYFHGTLTPGFDVTSAGFSAADQEASVTISLTQTGGVGKTISFSGTLNTPPATVGSPEPATFVALASGLGVIAFARFRRKSV
jgi:hypothetical protein